MLLGFWLYGMIGMFSFKMCNFNHYDLMNVKNENNKKMMYFWFFPDHCNEDIIDYFNIIDVYTMYYEKYK